MLLQWPTVSGIYSVCLARIYAWYEQRIIDRPPVRFLHHNIEYEKHRTV